LFWGDWIIDARQSMVETRATTYYRNLRAPNIIPVCGAGAED